MKLVYVNVFQRPATRETPRIPARREALREHLVPRLQRLRDLPGRHIQHGDRPRVPCSGKLVPSNMPVK